LHAVVSTLDGDPVTTTTITTTISIILVPLEPTEGRDRLKHMLQNAQPALVLVAADCDQQRLQEIISQSSSSSSISHEHDSGDSHSNHHQEIILPQLIDIRTWIQDIAQHDHSPASVDTFYDRENLKQQSHGKSFAFFLPNNHHYSSRPRQRK